MRVIRTAFSASLLAGVALISGCASHRAAPAIAVAPPAPIQTVTAPPPGSYPGMPIPARLADGSYDTPNRALTAAATVWHFRAGLNVAALACRGADEAIIAARYNAILARQRSVLRDAEASLANEYRSGGGSAWRGRYDHAMTVLYNFFSQGFAHQTFCSTASRILGESETVTPAAFPAFAAARLPMLDAAFTDFYARYDRWRASTAPAKMAAPAAPPIVALRTAPSHPKAAPVPSAPWIQLDQVALLPDPDGREVRAGRRTR
ncbi:hypothetical protein [Sphingomonas sp. PAMC 26605]|uniref:hypothetical protein n=1 Tax=Sphingomonas sp. PAMC 26605 TaxID=1112214 RepID=UPI00026CD01C|nr:hypothetical protein [Sphingomonas sp. PAMC 26605]